MTGGNKLGRRSFLVVGGAVVLGGAALAGVRIADRDEPSTSDENFATDVDSDDERVIALAALLQDPAAAARIGNVYRERDPQAPHTDVLKLLEGLGVTKDSVDGLDRGHLASNIRRECHVDWLETNSVDIDGWRVPRTFADLCATAAREFGS